MVLVDLVLTRKKAACLVTTKSASMLNKDGPYDVNLNNMCLMLSKIINGLDTTTLCKCLLMEMYENKNNNIIV